MRPSAAWPRGWTRCAGPTARRPWPSSRHGCGASWFGQLMKAFGSPNIGAPSYAQCRGPREAGYGAHLRRGPRVARAHRPRARALHHPHRQPPRREHAQHPGAGLRRGARPRGRARGGGPALLDRGRQGALLAADQARHRSRAAARVDERHPRGAAVRRRLPRGARHRPRGAQGARGRQDPRVGLPADGAPARADSRERPLHRLGPAGVAHSPRPPHDLVRR